MSASVVTRFAPSPTGELHLGNARTALFNWLLARRSGGRFVLRVEDTDAGRSTGDFVEALLRDLHWLGLDWEEGPDRGGPSAPYRQSERGANHAADFAALEAAGVVYPCFCTPVELEVARRAQRAAGRPPRYAGTCRELDAAARASRLARGLYPSLRFRVPGGRHIGFTDLVHGPLEFLSDDIGDFVVRRADGTPAFFFGNAVDDAAMGVTHVLRGEDHLANTPRQLLVLEALGRATPSYGHLSLLLGADGVPLSKRHGATSLRKLREQGHLPVAIRNYLFRLGHSTPEHGLLGPAAMADAFDPAHLGRAPARFDEAQLHTWQKAAVHRLSPEDARRWLAQVLPGDVPEAAVAAFVEAVLPNVVFPEDARPWVETIFRAAPALGAEEARAVAEAGPHFFAAAAAAAEAGRGELGAIVRAVRETTGRKGAAVYGPLRLALTGQTHGPELAALLRALPMTETVHRLGRFAS